MKKYRRIIAVLLAFSLAFATACGCSAPKQTSVSYPVVTELADDETLENVCEIMKNAELSHIDIFKSWVDDFVKVSGENAKLTNGFVAPDKIESDVFACMDGWEANHDFSDADCRITAMLLLDGILTAEKTDKEYNGTYLMFDTDALDTVPRYSEVAKNKELFTTLFGETDIISSEHPEETFPQKWQDYGFDINSDRVSLVTVVNTTETNQVYVGHTGVLIFLGESYLFIEKLAYEQPYRVTKLDSEKQLIDIFDSRSEYFENEDKTGTYYYINDSLLSR